MGDSKQKLPFGSWFRLDREETWKEFLVELLSVLENISPEKHRKFIEKRARLAEKQKTEDGREDVFAALAVEVTNYFNTLTLPDMVVGLSKEEYEYGYWPMHGDFLYATDKRALPELVKENLCEMTEFFSLVGLTAGALFETRSLPLCDIYGEPWTMAYIVYNVDDSVREIWASSSINWPREEGAVFYGLFEADGQDDIDTGGS